jgi:hypothetical protein
LNDDDARSLIERHLLEQGAQIKEKFFEFCRTHFISKRQRQRAVQRLRIRMVQIGGASNTVRYYCLPSQSPPSVLDHSPALRRAVDFLKKTLSNGPMPRRKVLRIARQHNLNTPSVLVRATLFAGVVSEKSKEHRNHVIWSLVSNGMNGHVSAMLNPAAPPQSVPTTTPAKSHKRRGPDKKVQTLNIENFCYEAKKAGKSKDFVIANDVKREFKLTSFARSSVVKYARRRAERPEDPRPWPIKR